MSQLYTWKCPLLAADTRGAYKRFLYAWVRH